MHDVVIVGGSAAGLSAALVLGRFRRRVLVCDTNRPRNAVATAAHGFLTQDGTPPAEILRLGREQLRPYESVELRNSEIVKINSIADGFELMALDGATYQAKRVLLATGLKDELPAIAGLADYWGKGIYHCPYCHGWEARDLAIVAIGNADAMSHLGLLLRVLSDRITVVIQGESLSDAQQEDLTARGITIHHAPVVGIEGNGDGVTGVRLQDGTLLPCEAIFVRTIFQQHSPLAEEAGCAMNEHGFVIADDFGRTSVEGIYAAGDMNTMMQQLIIAAASGAKAAAGINMDMTFGH
jgi:thioredoxin reductase